MLSTDLKTFPRRLSREQVNVNNPKLNYSNLKFCSPQKSLIVEKCAELFPFYFSGNFEGFPIVGSKIYCYSLILSMWFANLDLEPNQYASGSLQYRVHMLRLSIRSKVSWIHTHLKHHLKLFCSLDQMPEWGPFTHSTVVSEMMSAWSWDFKYKKRN